MTAQTALAAAATVVAIAFALSTLERWLQGRKRHELAWTVALGLFAAGAGAMWLGATLGWSPTTFRAFYLFGAVLNVPVLALGTVYLLAGRHTGDRWAAVVALTLAFAAGVVVASPMTGDISPGRLPKGSEVFGALPRVAAALASAGGAAVVLGGALLSAWRAWKPNHPAHPAAVDPVSATAIRPQVRRLVAANLLIAAGTLVLGGSGLLNSVLGEMEAFAVTLVVGVSLLFGGFLVATAGTAKRAAVGRPRPRAVPELRERSGPLSGSAPVSGRGSGTGTGTGTA